LALRSGDRLAGANCHSREEGARENLIDVLHLGHSYEKGASRRRRMGLAGGKVRRRGRTLGGLLQGWRGALKREVMNRDRSREG